MRTISTGTLCAMIIASLLMASAASVSGLEDDVNPGWGVATLVETDNTGGASDPQVAVDGSGNAIAVWYQFDGTRDNIWSSRYVIGTGWGAATLIETDNSGDASNPQVAVDGSGDAIAVWQQDDGLRYNIWSNRYVVGTGWGAAALIETDNSGGASNPQVAVDGSGDAIAAWCQYDGTRTNICSNRYVVGIGWETAKLLETDNSGSAYLPQVAIDGSGNATAVWYQSDGTRYNVCSNRYVVGTGWGIAALIEIDNTGGVSSPQVAVDGSGNAIAVWYQSDGTRNNICSNRYVVGTGWGIATLIETDNSGSAVYPQVAVDGSGDAIAVWYQSDGTRNNIWSSRYVVGTGWGIATLIETDNLGDAARPQVAVDGSGNATAVWHQFDGALYNVWSSRYVVGIGWETAKLLETDNSGGAAYPQVAVDGSGNAIAVWYQWDGTRSDIWSNRYVKPDTIPPPLSLDSPSDGLTTETVTVTVSGTTEPGVTLSINGILVAVESAGSFSCTIALVEGVNTITATATDASDNSATVSVSVTYTNHVPALEEELNDAIDELNTIQDDLNAVEDELSGTSDDLNDVRSQNLMLMALLAVFAVLFVVMLVMFFSLRKKIADMGGKAVEEETPPPPQG